MMVNATNLKAMNLKATNSKSMLIPQLFIGSSILLAASVFAHHSFAPHFDASKPVHITGVVTEFEERNPHAYLHIRAENADGLLPTQVVRDVEVQGRDKRPGDLQVHPALQTQHNGCRRVHHLRWWRLHYLPRQH